MLLKIFLYWLPMVAIAFANAAIRESVLMKQMDTFRAHQLSTIGLIVFCCTYIWFIFPHLPIHRASQAALAGVVWVLLTVLFEFSMGRLTNKSWSALFENYRLLRGYLWPVFLICLGLAPYLIFIWRRP
jgi:hypothetical protein